MQGLKNLPPLHLTSGNHQECISSNQRETIQETVLNYSNSFEEPKDMSLQNENLTFQIVIGTYRYNTKL